MKIAKLTWLHNGNYGTILQAFALQRFLLDNGFDIIDIDYKASLKTKLLNWYKSKNSLKLFLNKFKNYCTKHSSQELFAKRAELFNEFKQKNIKLTQRCSTREDLKALAEEYDVFICGSDQIWSPRLLNPVFFLDFVPPTKKRIAYAPSFGVNNTTSKKKKLIAEYLDKFDYISVREVQGQKLIKQITEKDVPVLVDPTMLLSSQKWIEYAIVPVKQNKYIFCYMLTPNQIYAEAIKKIAKERNLEVVNIITENGSIKCGFEDKIDIDPSEWLGYILKAELVCTDSFHGCIFAALFEREFILFKRFLDNNKDSENSRIYTLMDLFNTTDRIIDQNTVSSIKTLKEINYEYIKKIIKEKSDESAKWLIDSLN